MSELQLVVNSSVSAKAAAETEEEATAEMELADAALEAAVASGDAEAIAAAEARTAAANATAMAAAAAASAAAEKAEKATAKQVSDHQRKLVMQAKAASGKGRSSSKALLAATGRNGGGEAGGGQGSTRFPGRAVAPAAAPAAAGSGAGSGSGTAFSLGAARGARKAPREFGGMLRIADEQGGKKMGFPFLLRMASALTEAKIAADKKAMHKGLPLVPMPEFVASEICKQYGNSQLANGMFNELYRGLAESRLKSTRLRLFAGATGLFPDSQVGSSRYSLLLVLLDNVTELMDRERAVSGTRRDVFFHKWGEASELFLPAVYVQRGLAKTLEGEEPRLQLAMDEAMHIFLSVHSLSSVSDCAAWVRGHDTGVLSKSPCVLGTKYKKGGFVNLDACLAEVAHVHTEFGQARAAPTRAVYAKYDANGDGVFSRSEFEAMLKEISPEIRSKEVSILWARCGGESNEVKLDPAQLEARLSNVWLHKMSGEAASDGAVDDAATGKSHWAGAARAARSELGVLVHLWENVSGRLHLPPGEESPAQAAAGGAMADPATTSTAAAAAKAFGAAAAAAALGEQEAGLKTREERLEFVEHLLSAMTHWSCVVRLQAMARGWGGRAKARALATASHE